jgi:hypothetical protein
MSLHSGEALVAFYPQVHHGPKRRPVYGLCTIYLFCSLASFRSVDHRIENESLENFQDIKFEDLEQQPVGFEGKCP